MFYFEQKSIFKLVLYTLTWSGLPSVSKYIACVPGSLSACCKEEYVLVDPQHDSPCIHFHAPSRLVSFTSTNRFCQTWALELNAIRLNFILWRNCSWWYKVSNSLLVCLKHYKHLCKSYVHIFWTLFKRISLNYKYNSFPILH